MRYLEVLLDITLCLLVVIKSGKLFNIFHDFFTSRRHWFNLCHLYFDVLLKLTILMEYRTHKMIRYSRTNTPYSMFIFLSFYFILPIEGEIFVIWFNTIPLLIRTMYRNMQKILYQLDSTNICLLNFSFSLNVSE